MSAPTRTAAPAPPPPDRLRRRRRAWLAVALVTCLVVALATGLGLLPRLVQQTYSGSTVYRQRISALTVSADATGVVVRAGPAGEVTIRQDLSWTTARPRVRVDRNGGTLTVAVQCGDGLLAQFGCDAELTILVPPQTALTSTGSSGDLTVQWLSGPLNLHTGSGGIQLDEVSGAVQAVTDSGTIGGEGLRSAQFQARSGSGPVDAIFTLPPQRVRISTGSGPVDLGLPRGSSYRLGGSSTSGPRDVDESLADASAGDSITVDTTSGPVDIGY